ncbi:hypothetical protein [Pedobacter sp. SL55]|uniref:hypothetical protein n=1 Tax=Pedobacter sp. SL55 TaxID=2995161 RepID=UPI00226D458C|nr:hypothetical protein [Pedobacter sp. SL55]WAC41203.1 hypothetical protein OVA16_02170 [Pedobacter sp. SL55]WAC42157.1 hypothetical protein OVA16_07335 [Pedobacter sp. SL55]
MKKIVLLFLLLSTSSFKLSANSNLSQKYFILDENSNSYQFHTIKLSNKGKQIELYNLLYDQSNLILFSVLPVKGDMMWSEIEVSKIKGQIIDFPVLKQIFSEAFNSYQKSNFYDCDFIKRQDISLVINKNGKFFVSSFCLSEYFSIVTQSLVFPNLMANAIINISSPTIAVKDFESKYYNAYGHYSPNAITERSSTGTTNLLRPLEKPLLFRSEEIEIFGFKAYKFWQFTDWHINHGINYYRGIDRFLFVPNIGIVAGSFDAFLSKNSADTMKAYLEEILILPSDKDKIKSKVE